MTTTAAARPGLPPRARVFVSAVGTTGTAVVLYSVVALQQQRPPLECLLFAALTLATGALSVKIPSIQSRFSVSEVFAFASALLFGPEAGAVILALDGLRISLAWRMSPAQTLFNFATLGLSMWLGAQLFFAASGTAPLFGGGAIAGSPRLVVSLALMTASYFAVNAGFIAGAIALTSGRSFRATWMEHYWPLVPSYLAGASIALLLVLAFREVQFTAIMLIVPLLVICYLTLRSSFGRLEDAKQHVGKLNRLLLSTVETLATAIDAKDEVTHDHVRRVQQGTMALARVLGVSDAQTLQAMEAAALLHDTGKIAIPEYILNKPGRLTPAEFEKMKRHAPIGADILSSIEFPYPVVPIVRHHHENWDGTGYPDGLRGEAIPLGARILSVVDCFDALTSDRPYRPRMTDAQALAILRERRGVMYDPAIVDAFLADYTRIMPAYDPTPHPAAVAIGDARAHERAAPAAVPADAPALSSAEPVLTEGLLAVASLSRALGGGANVGDLGTLLWTIFKQTLPSDAMAIFMLEKDGEVLTARYAAGTMAPRLRAMRASMGGGIVGWVAATGKAAVNADPALDLGFRTHEPSTARSCLAVPLAESGALVAVLALYRADADAFTEDEGRLLEVLSARLCAPLATADHAEPPAFQPAPLALLRHTAGV